MSDTVEIPDPLVGRVVAGRYHVVRRLAAGGMGVVYEATQEPLSRRVALKVIRGDIDDPVARKRFEREAKAASAISDPHVVVIHDFGVVDEGAGRGLYLAMEYVAGETLRAWLTREGRIAWPRTLPVVEQIAHALAAAHAQGLVHRDLKPENVMLVATSNGPVDDVFCKVLDFGLAKGVSDDLLRSHGGEAPLTRSGGFVGTPGYISPETLHGAAESPSQDVYALGVLWWELLCGRHPFPAETPMKTLLRQMHEEPPALDDVLCLTDGIPAAGAQLVRDLMARDPRHRPADGAAVLRRLGELPVSPRTAALATPDAPTVARGRAPQVPQGAGTPPEAPTVDLRGPRPAPSAPSTRPAGPAPRRGAAPGAPGAPQRRRLLPWVLGSAALTASLGVALLRVLDHAPAVDNDEPPPPPPVVVDAGVVRTEVVVLGLSSFSALKRLRAAVPVPHALSVYRPGRSELIVDGDHAGAIADVLQGHVIDVDGAPLQVEVRELHQGLVVLSVDPPVDAGGEAPTDAGNVVDGGLVTPGGLEP